MEYGKEILEQLSKLRDEVSDNHTEMNEKYTKLLVDIVKLETKSKISGLITSALISCVFGPITAGIFLYLVKG